MINRNTSRRSNVTQTTRYGWVAAAFFIATLILGAFAGIPRVEADSDRLQWGVDADAAQYQAMGESYLTKADDDFLAANPELMVARRSYRSATSLLAANPELMVARRSYRPATSLLVANPELMVARRWHSPSINSLGSCSPADEATLAVNPELILVNRGHGC